MASAKKRGMTPTSEGFDQGHQIEFRTTYAFDVAYRHLDTHASGCLPSGAKRTQEVVPLRRQMIQFDHDMRRGRVRDRAAAIF
jgi:hypothetical protein